MFNTPIYLDYNATTPIDREVADAMLPYLYVHFGNPSSSHSYGQTTREAVYHARAQVAVMLGAVPDEVIFTSGGTEANNMVIKGVAKSRSDRGKHIITSAVEHPAILEPCQVLAEQGYEITVLPVDELGRVNPADVEAAIRDDTILVTVMLANNEVGTVQPIEAIAAIAHAHGALMHTDAAQAVGKLPVDVKALGVDFLSVAGHKLYAPKGIGALYVREGITLPKFMHGASHEDNRRAGTENVLEIVGLGKAAEIAVRDLSQNIDHMRAMRDLLYGELVQQAEDVRCNGQTVDHLRCTSDLSRALPNTLSVSFKNVQANALLDRIAGQVAASAGAACHADQVTVSTVLSAMNVPTEYAMGTLRLSTGKLTTAPEATRAATIIAGAVKELRGS